ncbi:MAG: hypothetical protein E3J87_02170 [Candidatus Cloacimonadota bacterium]|nr:MAG: hypothetical protein E3J87_02170 [Candidatus Cloacimonadota bacterium]
MRIKRTVLLTLVVLLISFAFVSKSSAVTIDEIIKRLEENQGKIKDLEADVVMEVNNVAGMITAQELKVWSKGDDKTKIEIVHSDAFEDDSLTFFPTTVIINGSKMSIGQRGKTQQVIDIEEIQDKGKVDKRYEPMEQFTLGMGLLKGMGDFLRKSEVSIVKEEGNKITLSIIPEETNLLMQKINMVVDMGRGVITQQKMYSNMGINFCRMEYEKKDEIWILRKFTMTNSFGQMGTSTVKVEYKNIQLNKGIENVMFEIK